MPSDKHCAINRNAKQCHIKDTHHEGLLQPLYLQGLIAQTTQKTLANTFLT